MKIALIGPGLRPVPPQGWVAVEILIWDCKIFLEKMGHRVEIFNSQDLRKVAAAINNGSYDFVHAHHDEHVIALNRLLKRVYCNSSHCGDFSNTAQRGSRYWRIYAETLRSPGIIALSSRVAEQYRKDGYRGFLGVLRNGADCDRFSFHEKGNGRAICLGKIEKEDRKSQILISRLLREKVPIDFVGPCGDLNFQADGLCRYLGAWDKETVFRRLTEYSCLVLVSRGELAPLVVPEALAAGLSLVVSDAASANLHPKPFISVLPDHDRAAPFLMETIHKQIAENAGLRHEIRKYAREYFDWSIIMQEYLKLIDQFNAQPRKYQAGSPGVMFKGRARRLREVVARRLPFKLKVLVKRLLFGKKR